jgi:hypothetical protein
MASNVVSTTDQARMDFQYSSTVDGLLKNVYIPALNNVTFHATPLMDMFGDFGGTIDFASSKIIKAFKTQNAGGFRAISEGGDWAEGKDQKGFQGFERIKFLNAYCSLTGPAARTVKAGEGGYADAISSSMDDTLKNAKMQMERIIGGKGNGVLLTGVAVASTWNGGATTAMSLGAAATATITKGDGGYSAVQWLQEGMVVDFHTTLGTRLVSATVTAVDYAAETATITPAASLTIATGATFYLTLPYAYGAGEDRDGTSGDGISTNSNETTCLEPNGLGNLVSATATDYIWGWNRSTHPRALKSKVVAAAGAELDEELMMGWILDMVNLQQTVPNLCVVDPRSRLKYFGNMKDDRRFNMPIIDTPFGFRSAGVVIDQYTLILQSLSSLAPGTLFILNTSAFKFAKATNGWEWVTSGQGGIFRQKEGSDNLYASAVNYMNFVCEDPKSQMKVTGLSY